MPADQDPLTIGGATIWHLAVALQTPEALAPLWWGPPGMGKTSLIELLVDLYRKECGYDEETFRLETMIASTCDPTDFRGLPIPSADRTRFMPPEEAVRLALAGRGLLFLDEANGAVPAVQAALLRVVHKRVMGLLALPPEVWIAGAANPPEEAAGGWDQAAAMGNRWTHLVTTYDDLMDTRPYTKWLRHGVTESLEGGLPIIDRVRWDREFESTKILMAAFIDRNPRAQAERPSEYRGRFPLAFASRRSNENLARLHASLRCIGREDELDIFARGSIGPGYATPYTAWVRMVDLPDPEALLRNPSLAVPDSRRPDRDYAIVMAVAAAATHGIKKDDEVDPTTMDRYVAGWKVAERYMTAGKELVGMAATEYLVAKRPRGGLTHPDVRPVTAQLAPVLRGAGLMV